MKVSSFDLLFVEIDRSKVEQGMAVRADDQNVPFNVGSIMGFAERSEVMNFSVALSVCQLESLVAPLAPVFVFFLDPPSKRAVSDDAAVSDFFAVRRFGLSKVDGFRSIGLRFA